MIMDFLNTDYSIDIYFKTDALTADDVPDINTWETFHLIPTERPSVATPEVKSEYVEIPGMNGALDYTEVLAGTVRYGNRSGSWEFIVGSGNGSWFTIYDSLRYLLHGKRVQCVLREQKEYSYIGRLELDSWKTGDQYSTITINYNFEPYKTYKEGLVSDWLWDSLTFDTDVYKIMYGTFSVNGTRYRNFYNGLRERVEVSFSLSENMRISQGRLTDNVFDAFKSKTLTAGRYYEHSGFFLNEFTNEDTGGDNYFMFECAGLGTVSVNYKRGGDEI